MNQRSALLLFGLVSVFLPACGGGGGSGGSSARLTIVQTSNGFGQMLPHQTFRVDSQGNPTSQVVELTTVDALVANVNAANPIFPPPEWPTQPILPNGDPGNHFLYTRFSQELDIESILDRSVGGGLNNNLTGTITVLAVDPLTGATTRIPGRAFIGGFTYGAEDPANPTELLLEQWVTRDGNGKPVANGAIAGLPGLGFPGTDSTVGFAGAGELVDPKTFVFIPDADGDLSTYETFPIGVQIRIRMTREVRARNNNRLEQEGLGSATVGPDNVAPEVAVSGQTQVPVIIPGNGEPGVDPETNIVVEFSEPVQIRGLGELNLDNPPSMGSAIQVMFGPATATVEVPYHVGLLSIFDLSRVEIIPSYTFPGSGPNATGISCGDFSEVRIVVNADQFMDLADPGNMNTLNPSTSFITGEGPGLVNAPVTPDTIYVARGGSNPGISVVDLNGFGAGTGNPTYDEENPVTRGNSNYPNNPNLVLQGSSLIPFLVPGTCTFDGGSEGVFSLTKDSQLNSLVARSPTIESAGDMALGHPLDIVFNNADPNGCQSGGGNICASTGFKRIQVGTGGANTTAPIYPQTNNFNFKDERGAGNLANWSPHPNPPRLVFPPLCLDPLIAAQEPTTVLAAITPVVDPAGLGLTNLLTPGGNPLGNPLTQTAPDSLLATEQNAFFLGPAPPAQQITSCREYMQRQQIGHFLYVVDRVRSEVTVLNSNRFTVVDRIQLPDPTSLAMSPNLELLAVTNQGADVVSIIDTNPTSSTFHKVVRQVTVGNGPTGIAWESTNEDIFVCNTGDGSVSLISVFTLNVRKVLRNQLSAPIDVALTPRQFNFGFSRFVYFGYILNADGRVAIFESGPDGINGWGFDDVIGSASMVFRNPKAIQPDVRNLNSACWIVHENQLNVQGQPTGLTGGAVTNLALNSGRTGVLPLSGNFGDPQIRDLEFRVLASIGSDQLTGVPVDIAFDNQLNQAPITNFQTQFSAGTPASINGKTLVRQLPNNFQIQPSYRPRLMFLAVPNSTEGPGVIDVIDLNSGFQRFDTDPFLAGVQSVQAPGALGLMDYFRQ